jgi:hypothetical protein
MAIRRLFALMAAIGLILVAAIPVAANDRNHYTVNVLATGPTPDADLVNGWGISRLPTSPWWVADNGTDLSTLYRADGTKQGLRVAIPMGAPTGTVSNTNAADFHGDLFLFSSEAGVISGWRGALGTTAEVGNGDHAGDAVYKGLAIATADVGKGMATYLYATDFHNGRIDVFDSSFASQTWPGAFTDPKLPKGYAPFGIQNLKGLIFVTYAKTQPGSNEAHARGSRRRRLPEDGTFFAASPGGRAERAVGSGRAPSDFAPGRPHRRQLLAAALHAPGMATTGPAGLLSDTQGAVVDACGDRVRGGPPTTARSTLFFAAGPDDGGPSARSCDSLTIVTAQMRRGRHMPAPPSSLGPE